MSSFLYLKGSFARITSIHTLSCLRIKWLPEIYLTLCSIWELVVHEIRRSLTYYRSLNQELNAEMRAVKKWRCLTARGIRWCLRRSQSNPVQDQSSRCGIEIRTYIGWQRCHHQHWRRRLVVGAVLQRIGSGSVVSEVIDWNPACG